MKRQILLGTLLVQLVAVNAQGGLSTKTFGSGEAMGVIPDGNPLGAAFSGTVSDLSGLTVVGLTVTLSVSGGYAGNLYAYLVAPNGTMVMLLNEPGVTSGTPFGNPATSMDITLADGTGAINASSDLTTGTYSAAGTLAGFNGSSADGTWTLFFADEVSGGGTSTLNEWSLGISTVPEPVNVALAIFGGLLGVWSVIPEAVQRASTIKNIN